ncbi:nuclear pore complex protein Nup58-like isoform X2 [Pieris brassicae]|uniref:nuclear pore complex protein Nup58-like isoform X2 n=1 Tax=Pieris brassicae TaxID=7116 RepID=UPI001E661F2E|nr:nuclear pore complex protein Nup58-like isoform X2 [Pieris brassicae]
MSFSFGTPSSAPATGLSGGFSFGANKPATPAFGLGGTQPSLGLFGTPATSAPAFGTTTPAFGSTPAFGATSTAPTFGANATPAFGASSGAPTFGASSTPAFGSTATPAFGAISVAPTFGATSSAPAFGATTTPAFGATTTPAFGATTTPAFSATSNPAFGATSTPAFGATSTPAFGLSFGTTTTTSAGLGGLGGFGFSGTTTAQPNIGLGVTTTTGSFVKNVSLNTAENNSIYTVKCAKRDCYPTVIPSYGKLNTSNGQEPCLLLAPREELRFATTSLGLGGAAPANTAGASDGKSEPPKQTKLPNEVSTTVEAFKEFVKKQKSLSSDIMRVSIKPLQKVSREAECTLRLAMSLNGETSRCRAQSRRLRTSAAAALAAAETANRDPPGSELEGMTPPTYVKDLISELEQQIITFRRQMDVADKQMQSSPKLLTEQELTMGMRRMHESFVALAGRLQAVHAQVRAQKEQYLNFRKYVLKDPTDVFDTSASASLDQILRDAEGTRKKSKSGNPSESGFDGAVLSDPRAALGTVQQLAGPTPFTYLGSTLSPFSAAEAQGSNWQPTPQAVNSSLHFSGFGSQTDSFQLQKPPGKRGKQ